MLQYFIVFILSCSKLTNYTNDIVVCTSSFQSFIFLDLSLAYSKVTEDDGQWYFSFQSDMNTKCVIQMFTCVGCVLGLKYICLSIISFNAKINYDN